MGSKLHKAPCRLTIGAFLADGQAHAFVDINKACVGYATNTVKNVVSMMTEDGTIERVGRGQYRLNAEKEASRG